IPRDLPAAQMRDPVLNWAKFFGATTDEALPPAWKDAVSQPNQGLIIMKLNHHSALCRSSSLLRSLLLGLACLGAPAFTLGCGADSSNVDNPGNPPVVSEQKLRVEAADSGVSVVGEPGAVPGRAAIEVTNVATEQSETTTAAAD